MIEIRRARLLALGASVALLVGCDESRDHAPLAPVEQPGLSRAASAGQLLECPIDEEVTATATIDERGGTLRAIDGSGGRHEVIFPAGAVSEPTRFTLTAPASRYVLVRVTATDARGAERLTEFPPEAQPTLAVSYKRCPRSVLGRPKLQLFQVDERTKAPITRAFGGKENNASDPRVRGEVPHFSEYAVGSPEDVPVEPVIE